MTQVKSPRYAVVTGCSTGIGKGIVEYFCAKEIIVLAGVRSETDARNLLAEFGEKVVPLIFDMTDENAIDRAVEKIESIVKETGLFALVNNAGVAISIPILDMDAERLRYQLEVNLVSVVMLTKKLLPLLGARDDYPHQPGRIINISSVSGKIAFPFLGPYVMSKHGLEGFSDVLRRELIPFNIKVVVIEPGNTDTPIWSKVPDPDTLKDSYYHPMLVRVFRSLERMTEDALPVNKIARAVYRAATVPKPKTRYAYPNRYFTGWLIPRFIPDRWLDQIVAQKLFGK